MIALTSSTRMTQLKRFGLLLGVALLIAGQAGVAQQAGDIDRLVITAGRSMVLTTDFNIERIAVTNPEVADAQVVEPRELLIDGRAPGTISLILWGPGIRRQYDLVVETPITTLEQHLRALFPGEDIRIDYSDEAIILSGNASSTAVMLRVGEIASASSSQSEIINMLQVPGGSVSEQVMLQVRFAEINRTALFEAGFSFFSVDRFVARTTTQQFSSPDFEGGDTGVELVFSDFLNLFFFDQQEGIGGVLRALREQGAFRSLAEPNLVAYNGQEASFLAGGEFPVPIVQGVTGAVSVEFKEFGIRLNFTPTIAGDVIRLKVSPEVSALDFNNGISLGGFRIPALITRRAETDVELRDGQSFAIAGLLNNISQNDRADVPVLSAIPIIGSLFRSKAERAEETELMVLITPRLVQPLEPDEVPPLPTDDVEVRPNLDQIGQQFEGAGLVDAPQLANQQ